MNFQMHGSGGGVFALVVVLGVVFNLVWIAVGVAVARSHAKLAEAAHVFLGFSAAEGRSIEEGDAELLREFLKTDAALAYMGREQVIARFCEWRKARRGTEDGAVS